jgi:ribosomal protein S18 acetylase RimI-like enzyme
MATQRAGGLGWAAEPKVSGLSPPTYRWPQSRHTNEPPEPQPGAFFCCFTELGARRFPRVRIRPVRIEVVKAVSDELVEAFLRLTPQLSAASPPSADELTEVVRSPATSLLVAREGDAIVGTLTLAVFRIPTGVRAWIEDVVVDESARGLGVGEALTRAALERAAAAGARSVELTSRPNREAANRLYRRLGFERRETNVLRLTLG